ncbi:uridine kinase [Fangia hongkongensis]|uniref:uridine kinase n=1 Tax=Fangia hongkongensis TaxID=270495 RepID=UPI00035F6CAC|nr:uridine kinase [Fangia hongkongensis]MBK2125363.1 uridine kinase [Fangia hongkongensis]
MKNKSLIIIGVVGGSGSGKSLLSNTIVEELEEIDSQRVTVLSEDHYYRNNSHLSAEELSLLNYDHPDAFEHELLKSQLKSLIAGHDIQVPIYDYSTHSRLKGEFHPVSAQTTVLILEGIMLYTDKELRDLMDIKLFMDTPMDVSFIRRLLRDQKERGRTVDSIVSQYLETVRPMFLQFIEPSKRYADIIVPQGGKNKIAIDIIRSKVKELLRHYD